MIKDALTAAKGVPIVRGSARTRGSSGRSEGSASSQLSQGQSQSQSQGQGEEERWAYDLVSAVDDVEA